MGKQGEKTRGLIELQHRLIILRHIELNGISCSKQIEEESAKKYLKEWEKIEIPFNRLQRFPVQ